jgi:orotidine-5'-phosphate decarboxylase
LTKEANMAALAFRNARDRVFLALDVPTAADARALIDRLAGEATSFKVGLQLFCNAGPDFVAELAGKGLRIFLDLKFHDIPNTVAGAVRSVASLGAAMINLHCSGGAAMMRAAREALPQGEGTALLGVTVLTSLDDDDLRALGVAHSSEGQVLLLARMARQAGLDGVICSPKEIHLLRAEMGDDFLLVTPGIRPAWSDAGDQKRITTPREAIAAGASALVIGRPVTGADNPAEAMRRVIEEIG